MIYLLLAILSSAMIAIVMRVSTQKTSGGVSMLAMNYLMCLVLAAGFTGVGNLFPKVPGLSATLGFGALNGVLFLLAFVMLQVNTRRNGVVLSSVFMKLGLLVPMVLSVCFFGEKPGVTQVIGFAVAIAAIVLINSGAKSEATGFRAGLILLLLAGGSGDAMAKVFEELGPAELSPQFLFYTFVVAFLLCVGLTLWKKERPGKAEVLFGLLIGIPNFFSARFLLMALEKLDAVLVYPTYSVATLLVVTLAGVLFFRERLRTRQWVAVGAILAALVLLNI